MFAELLKILRNFEYVCRVSEKFGTKSHNEKKSLVYKMPVDTKD